MSHDELEEVMKAVRRLLEVHHLGDFIYEIRDHEGLGWDGPKVTSFNRDILLLQQAVADYFV